MKIVMLNGQNHKGSTYHIGRMIIDKISGETETVPLSRIVTFTEKKETSS